ncbi:MAG: hypothetical protein ACRD2Q_08680 [Terriglobales bacterium]
MGDEPSNTVPKGQPLALDLNARSATPDLPAFLNRPAGAPVYHGFEVTDLVVDGFTFGKITDFETEPAEEGDAFIIAPDDSRCGLNWYVQPEPLFREVMPIEAGRWGVWDVGFAYPMTSRENVRKNLEAILPQLREKWLAWKEQFGT